MGKMEAISVLHPMSLELCRGAMMYAQIITIQVSTNGTRKIIKWDAWGRLA